MEGGALFKVRSEAKERVLAAFAAIDIRKNEVGGYAYNDANTLITEIKRVLAEQLFEDSMDEMTGLLNTAKNTLMEYKVTSSIKCKDGEKAAMVSQETESAYATTKSKGGIRNRHRSKSSNGKNVLEYNALQNVLFYKINVIDQKLVLRPVHPSVVIAI